jgi:ferredoxin-NADP reductase
MHAAALVRREAVAEATTAFHFERPAGFAFVAGQALDLVLPAPAGDGPDDARHAFSIVSAPFQDEVVIATRMRASPFKRALGALPDGARLALDGPFGDMTLDPGDPRPAVLVAGGIGITPFMSMLRQAAHDRLPRSLTLVYSNRRPEDAAFLDELGQLQQRNPDFRMIATMTRMRESQRAWGGERGAVDDALLRQACADLSQPVFYVAGPSPMVEGMCQTLELAGVRNDAIRSEAFYGY